MIGAMAWSLSAMGARLATNLALFFLMARAWGPEAFGGFMVRLAIATVVTRLIDYGFSNQMSRDIGAAPANTGAILRRVIWAKAVLSAAVGLVALGALGVLSLTGPEIAGTARRLVGHVDLVLGVLLLDAVVQSFAAPFGGALRGLGVFDADARVSFATHAAIALGGAAAVACDGGPLGVAAALLGGHVLQLLLARRALRTPLLAADGAGSTAVGTATNAWPGWSTIRSLLWTGLPFAVHVAVATLALHVDGLVTAAVLAATAVGLYQAGLRIVIGLMGVIDGMAPVYSTAFARAIADPSPDGRATVVALGTRFTRQMAAFAALVIGGLTLTAPWLTVLLFGPAFAPLAAALPWFGALLGLRAVAACGGIILTLAGRPGLRATVIAVSLGVTATLTAWGGTAYGMAGALGATLIGATLTLALYVMAIHRDWGTTLIDGRSAVLCVASVTSLCTSAFAPEAGALVAGSLLCLLGVLLGATPAEWRALCARVAGRTHRLA